MFVLNAFHASFPGDPDHCVKIVCFWGEKLGIGLQRVLFNPRWFRLSSLPNRQESLRSSLRSRASPTDDCGALALSARSGAVFPERAERSETGTVPAGCLLPPVGHAEPRQGLGGAKLQVTAGECGLKAWHRRGLSMG